MTDAEIVARLHRISRIIADGRYCIVYGVDPRRQQRALFLCEEQSFSPQLSQLVALALLDPLPQKPLLAPEGGRGERNDWN